MLGRVSIVCIPKSEYPKPHNLKIKIKQIKHTKKTNAKKTKPPKKYLNTA